MGLTAPELIQNQEVQAHGLLYDRKRHKMLIKENNGHNSMRSLLKMEARLELAACLT